MRVLLLLTLAISLNCSASNRYESGIIPMDYLIISDSLIPAIEKGHYILQGNLKMLSSNNPIENVLVGCTSSGKRARTDSLGAFSITLKSSDQLVYFYKDGWSEVVIEDFEFKEQHEVVLDVYMSQDQKKLSIKKKTPDLSIFGYRNKRLYKA